MFCGTGWLLLTFFSLPLKKQKRWPRGPSGLAGVPASSCPSTFGLDRSRFGKPEASLQEMPPEPGADSLVASGDAVPGLLAPLLYTPLLSEI